MTSGFYQQIKGLVVNEFYPKLMYLAPLWYLYQMPNGTNSAETVLACRKIFPRLSHSIGSRKHNKNNRSPKRARLPNIFYWYCMVFQTKDNDNNNNNNNNNNNSNNNNNNNNNNNVDDDDNN